MGSPVRTAPQSPHPTSRARAGGDTPCMETSPTLFAVLDGSPEAVPVVASTQAWGPDVPDGVFLSDEGLSVVAGERILATTRTTLPHDWRAAAFLVGRIGLVTVPADATLDDRRLLASLASAPTADEMLSVPVFVGSPAHAEFLTSSPTISDLLSLTGEGLATRAVDVFSDSSGFHHLSSSCRVGCLEQSLPLVVALSSPCPRCGLRPDAYPSQLADGPLKSETETAASFVTRTATVQAQLLRNPTPESFEAAVTLATALTRNAGDRATPALWRPLLSKLATTLGASVRATGRAPSRPHLEPLHLVVAPAEEGWPTDVSARAMLLSFDRQCSPDGHVVVFAVPRSLSAELARTRRAADLGPFPPRATPRDLTGLASALARTERQSWPHQLSTWQRGLARTHPESERAPVRFPDWARAHRKDHIATLGALLLTASPVLAIALVLMLMVSQAAALVFAAAVVIVGGLWVLSTALAAPWASRRRGARKPTEGEQFVIERVRVLARRAGVRPPPVKITDSDAINAAATWGRPFASCITVDQGLLTAPLEVTDAVLAHELSHIAHHDMLVLAAAHASEELMRWVVEPMRQARGLLSLLRPFAAMLGLFLTASLQAVLRARERLADLGAVVTLGEASGLLSALGEVTPPGRQTWRERLVRTHPTVGQRRALVQSATSRQVATLAIETPVSPPRTPSFPTPGPSMIPAQPLLGTGKLPAQRRAVT